MRDFSGALKNDSEWFTGSGAKLGPASSGAKIGPAFSEPCSGTGAQIGPSEPDFPPAQRSGVGEKRPNPNDSSDSSAEDQQPTKQRVLSKEEVREVCAASAGALPAGMFSKAIKTLICQAQMLRGGAQLAVQSELRSIMNMASEQLPLMQQSGENGKKPAGEDGVSLTEVADNAPYFSAACQPSNRPYYAPFDVDEFLAPSCRQCGWLFSTCTCCASPDEGSSSKGGKKKREDAPEAGEPMARKGNERPPEEEGGKSCGGEEGRDNDDVAAGGGCAPQTRKSARRNVATSKRVNVPV